jgi:hypothetical protein
VGRPRTWSDEDLREAVAGATSWRQVRAALGLRGGGSTKQRLRARAAELGLDTTHLPAPGAMPRRFSDDELRDAVAAAGSLHGVFLALGLAVGGSAWRRMQDHIVRLGLDTSHWRPGGVRPGTAGPRARPPHRPEAEAVRQAVAASRSLAGAMRELGLDPSNGSARRRFRRQLEELEVPTDHLAGQAWAAGRRRSDVEVRPLEAILVADSPYRGSSSRLRIRLVRDGVLPERCAECGLTSWQGRPAPLHLDHVNGDPRDNRRENLRLLCPNCHAQTVTYCGRNIGRGYSGGPDGHTIRP